MSNNPLFVSVIVPVFNGEKFLANAIHNIKSQGYQPLEIIVIDDGSIDKTAEIAAQFQDVIRYVYQSNRGPSAARNQGIQLAQGDVIAFLDVDDEWTENSLNLLTEYLANHADVEIAQGMLQEFAFSETVNSDLTIDRVATEAISEPYHFVNLGTAVYRRSVFAKVGLFDESLNYGEDADWFVRAWENGISKAVLDEVTLRYQRHQSNMTSGKDLVGLGLVKIYKKRLDRARQRQQPLELPPDFPSVATYLGTASHAAEKIDYTIISNDCWGGTVYQAIGTLYKTPFVGTRILPPCYLRLLKNLRSYLESPLTFTDRSRYDTVNQERKSRYFPIGLLKDDVEIHFYHEASEADAEQSWNRRLKRINWDNLFVKFSDGEVVWQGDYLPYLKEFEALNFPYKVCLTSQEYPGLPSTIFIPDFVPDGQQMLYISQKYFDVMSWLTKKRGNNIQAYLKTPTRI